MFVIMETEHNLGILQQILWIILLIIVFDKDGWIGHIIHCGVTVRKKLG